MQIELIGWRSEGLRCPNMDINLMSGENPAHVSLIQMPNGTAKTTTLTLIRAAMNGEAERWTAEEVRSFRRVGESHAEGTFILNLKIDGRPLTFELTFDFNEGKVDYSTTLPSLGGINPGWKPPISIRPFFDSKFVRLFIFDGELAQDLLDPKKSEASKAIDALFQLYLLEEIKETAEANWEQATKNKASEETGLTRQRNKVRKLQEHIEKIERNAQKKREELSSIEIKIEKLENNISENKSLDKDLRERLKEKEKYEIECRNQVEMTANDVMIQIRQPQSLHESFTDSLIELKSKLDKAKLPGKASRQFFIDLAEEKECICGRELDEKIRQVIKQRADLYLSDHTVAFLNGLKEDIRNNLLSGNSETINTLSDSIQQLQIDIYTKQVAETDCRSSKKKLIDQGDDEVKSWNKELEQAKITKANIDSFFEKINRPQNHRDDPRHYTKTLCLQALKKWLENEEQKLAEISETVDLRKRKQILQKIIDRSVKKASENLQLSIIEDCNEYLKIILHRDPIQISKIDHSLHLKDQGRGSEGQTLSVGYTFLTTLLERGQHQFPLVVDSPANSIDASIRRKIGKLIPQLCHQFIALTISTEREGFTDTLYQNSRNTKFLTVFRKTQGTEKLIQTLPQEGVVQTNNGVIVEGKDYFDKFDLEKYPEEG